MSNYILKDNNDIIIELDYALEKIEKETNKQAEYIEKCIKAIEEDGGKDIRLTVCASHNGLTATYIDKKGNEQQIIILNESNYLKFIRNSRDIDIKKIDELRDELRRVDEQIRILEDYIFLVEDIKVKLEMYGKVRAARRKRMNLLEELLGLCKRAQVYFEYP